MISNFKLSTIFLIMGFLGLFGTAYADYYDNSILAGIFIPVSVTGLALSLAFVTQALDNERKKDEEE